jgi:hypothetical protein
LFPPNIGVAFKLKGSHGDFLLFGVSVHSEDLVNLDGP